MRLKKIKLGWIVLCWLELEPHWAGHCCTHCTIFLGPRILCLPFLLSCALSSPFSVFTLYTLFHPLYPGAFPRHFRVISDPAVCVKRLLFHTPSLLTLSCTHSVLHTSAHSCLAMPDEGKICLHHLAKTKQRCTGVYVTLL